MRVKVKRKPHYRMTMHATFDNGPDWDHVYEGEAISIEDFIDDAPDPVEEQVFAEDTASHVTLLEMRVERL